MSPVKYVEPDNRYASHIIATDWTQVPIIEIACPV
jgi:hypothetical protein